MELVILTALFAVGWIAVALIGSQAYFRGEQTKPIHERNWRSRSFESLAVSVTGTETNYNQRTPGFRTDSYSRNLLPEQ